ncbi:succinylglutamate desuccinylase/aspartoacylase family protein [Halolamina sp.]|jgi:predicted deacylase|uniref:succinylglutamate desuccinylase/aspartoacylase domain-containing protein n=1 Tax=Halolamina sp. TaxID=1940283 RepID=UPI000223B5F8|nr:Succinylglutamate desuccinylase/aspartoacylase [halophilic archaeon DL31]
MQIHQLGEGQPELAIVAGIHGDEPCGVRAVERILEEAPEVKRPVKFIIANEEALAAGERFLEEDLNRAFPGDPDGTHESRLAHDLAREVQGCTVLALHSTQSYAEPIVVIDTVDEIARSLAPRLPAEVLIETDEHTDGRLIEHAHTIEVECGLQGSEQAAENAYWLVQAFLSASNVLAAPTSDERLAAPERSEVRVFRLDGPIPKPPGREYEVVVPNFEKVGAGERFAVADGNALTANEPFYPVLLSADGYDDIFGYAATTAGSLD